MSYKKKNKTWLTLSMYANTDHKISFKKIVFFSIRVIKKKTHQMKPFIIFESNL